MLLYCLSINSKIWLQYLCFQGNRYALEKHVDDNTKQHLVLMCSMVTKQQHQIAHLKSTLSRVTLNYSGNINCIHFHIMLYIIYLSGVFTQQGNCRDLNKWQVNREMSWNSWRNCETWRNSQRNSWMRCTFCNMYLYESIYW